VAGPLYRLRRVELVCRGAGGTGNERRRVAGGTSLCAAGIDDNGGAALRRHRSRVHREDPERDRRVRSCARRRHRARFARPARRRAWHRQVDAAAAGGGALRAERRTRAVCVGRGVGASDQVTRRSPRRRRRAALPARRDLRREHSRRDRQGPAAAPHRRLGPDRVLAEVSIGAGKHWPGTGSGDAVSVYREGAQHPDLPGRPRDQGRQHRRTKGARARGRISRASVTIRIASCARSRTGLARSASSASSR
jgi:hypothetical protein